MVFSAEQVQKICKTSYLPPDGGIADFCFCYDGTLWHFFYILYERGMPHDCHHLGQNTKLGYSSSPDLINWQLQAPAITTRPGKWDCGHVWAPAVVKKEDTWYMFYTGTDEGSFQKIGIVTSKDLKTWDYPLDEAVIDASKYPWAVIGGVEADADMPRYFNCRDPYLIKHNGQWLCYYTARTKDENENEAVLALATSTDLINWKDEGYVLAEPIFGRDGVGTYFVESPCVFSRDNIFYIVYNQGKGMKYVSSTDPYNFRDSEPEALGDHIFNFELIDLQSGLFGYSKHSEWMKLYFGKVIIKQPGQLSIR